MPLQQSLDVFRSGAAQCASLIANAHRQDAGGASVMPPLDREQITVAAFLNLFVAWETFLEDVISKLLCGASTISGLLPSKFASPLGPSEAKSMLIGTQRFFDYGNHDNVRKIARMYFDNGVPLEPHLGSIHQDLADMRTMRNASAHLSSTTQAALESLAQRILSVPSPGVRLYSLLMAPDPRSVVGNTVFAECQSKLEAAASLIVQ